MGAEFLKLAEHNMPSRKDPRGYLIENTVWTGGSSRGRIDGIDQMGGDVVVEFGKQGVRVEYSRSNWGQHERFGARERAGDGYRLTNDGFGCIVLH